MTIIGAASTASMGSPAVALRHTLSRRGTSRGALATLATLAALAAVLGLAGCRDAPPTAATPDGTAAPKIDAVAAFDCAGSRGGIACHLSTTGPTSARGARFNKNVGTPYAALSQTSFSFNSGSNQLTSTVAVQNLITQPFATSSDYFTYDGVGAKVFFASGPTNTGGTAGPVTLVNPDGTNGTFTATNQSFYTYAEQIPGNATNLNAKSWIFQLPGPSTTFSFTVYVNVALPDESGAVTVPAHTFAALAVGAGSLVSCAIRTGGAGYCWGDDSNGALFDGQATGERDSPTGMLGAGHSINSAATGGEFACVTATTGGAFCVGSNEFGQLGTSTNLGSSTPIVVPQSVPLPSGVTSMSAISSGFYHACAIANTGQVYCWGANTFGQLGTTTHAGGYTPTPTPQALPFPSGVSSFGALFAGGQFTCALANTGQLYCWGRNYDGELGTATNNSSYNSNPTPTVVPLPAGVTTWVAVSTGLIHMCAIANTGGLYCWGANGNEQLGSSVNYVSGNPTPTAQAVPLPSGVTSFVNVGAGDSHTCATANTGQVYCWGNNDSGQLGSNASTDGGDNTPTPQAVAQPSGVTSFTALASYHDHVCALANTGQVFCWGNNAAGAVGNPATVGSTQYYAGAVVTP